MQKEERIELMIAAHRAATELLAQAHSVMADLVRQREDCKLSGYKVTAVARELGDLKKVMQEASEEMVGEDAGLSVSVGAEVY